MEAIIERCCGLDVHQGSVTACLLVGEPGKQPRKTVRKYSTMTRDLLAMRDWLRDQGCTVVGMESTGVYWKPVYAVLEDDFELVVGNAHHIKNVPGRKTDVKDSEWIADLLRHGLIARSFVPPKPIRELRDLLRYRRKLVESRAAERNRLIKLIESANIKLSSVASNVFGVSGMAMLKALVRGDSTPQEMAELAKKSLRKKIPALVLALDGKLEEHHRFILQMQLDRLEQLDAHVFNMDGQIEAKLTPYRDQHDRLMTIPGVERITAAVLIAELGVDMKVFKTAKHVAAWAGVAPGNHESAGKAKAAQVRKGNIHLKTMLVEAAHGAARTRGTYFKNKFHRLRAKRGPLRAALAIGRKILIAAYDILTYEGVVFRELGETYLDMVDTTRVIDYHASMIERLGYAVSVTPKRAPQPLPGPGQELAPTAA
jgi:transposase